MVEIWEVIMLYFFRGGLGRAAFLLGNCFIGSGRFDFFNFRLVLYPSVTGGKSI